MALLAFCGQFGEGVQPGESLHSTLKYFLRLGQARKRGQRTTGQNARSNQAAHIEMPANYLHGAHRINRDGHDVAAHNGEVLLLPLQSLKRCAQTCDAGLSRSPVTADLRHTIEHAKRFPARGQKVTNATYLGGCLGHGLSGFTHFILCLHGQ